MSPSLNYLFSKVAYSQNTLARNAVRFLFSNTGINREDKLRPHFAGMDVFTLEINAHTKIFENPDHLQTVGQIPGETTSPESVVRPCRGDKYDHSIS